MRSANGYTLIEVLVAVVILGITMMGMQALLADRTIRLTGREERLAVANQLLNDRLDEVQLLARSQFAALRDTVEAPIAGRPEWTRETRVRASSNPNAADYRTVTVRVWSSATADTLARTLVVSQ